MAKAARISILDMIRRHAECWCEMERMYEVGSDDATDTKEYRALSDEAIELEWIVATATAHTSVEYSAQVKFINRVDLPEEDRVDIAWHLGRSARALGIRHPPRLRRSGDKMSPKAARRRLAADEAEFRALAAG
jgi:hypothetical protein